jgi:hypothetical protein
MNKTAITPFSINSSDSHLSVTAFAIVRDANITIPSSDADTKGQKNRVIQQRDPTVRQERQPQNNRKQRREKRRDFQANNNNSDEHS